MLTQPTTLRLYGFEQYLASGFIPNLQGYANVIQYTNIKPAINIVQFTC